MMRTIKYVALAATGAALGTLSMAACSSTSGGDGSGGAGGAGNAGGAAAAGGVAAGGGVGGSAAAGGMGNTGNFGGGINLDATPGDSGATDASACSKFETEATLEIKPVDVIFVVDNSCSMTNEAIAIEQNINAQLYNILQASGLDYRVIMIAEQGPTSQQSLCIAPPLGGTTCPVASDVAPINNPPIFFHYDNNDVESWDGWCKMMSWYDKPDRYNLAPTGWRGWLRPNAVKTFVMVTDDRVSCTMGSWSYNDGSGTSALTTAQKFDTDLIARDPAQFGTVLDRNYVWHSIIGVIANPTNPTKAYDPTEPITNTKCTSAVNTSTGNQALSQITGGLRFPVCEGVGFDVVFQEIAKGVIKGAKVACEFDVPQAPAGKKIDLDSVTVDYTPGGGGPTQNFGQVANAGACAAGKFYIENDKIKLCPQTCSVVEADVQAKLNVLVDCLKEDPK